MNKNQTDLFQITEAARACGLSRSTLMRLEEKGLIKPVYKAKESGRRYYNNYNISRILEIKKLQNMGLSNESIIAYYKSGGQIFEILEPLEKMLQNMQLSVAELKLRAHQEGDIIIEIITLPEIICRMKKSIGKKPQDKYDAMYSLYTECIKKGCVLSDEPLFDILDRSDFLNGYLSDEEYPFYVCVPLKEKTDDSVVIPACKALSVLYCGDYENSDKCWLIINEELKKRNLKPSGLPRVIGIIAAYTGKEIAEKKYCSRFVIPIEDVN